MLLAQSRQPVDTLPVLFLPVSLQTFRPSVPSPSLQLCPLTFVLEKRNTVPAGILDASDLDNNNRAHAIDRSERTCQRSKLVLLGFNHAAVPVQTIDIGRSLEGAEHQNDSAILLQVGDGLHSAAVEIELSHPGRAENTKRVEPLGREIDVPVRIQGGRGAKKDLLRFVKTPGNTIDSGSNLSHACPRIFCASSARGTASCSPLVKSFRAKESAFTSFSPTIKIYLAPALVAASKDFFSRKLSSPKSTTRS